MGLYIKNHETTIYSDKSIPPLEEVMCDQAADLEKLEQVIRNQMAFENKVKDKFKQEQGKTSYPNPATECQPPMVCHDFQTARLFLSHYGFLSLEALKVWGNFSSNFRNRFRCPYLRMGVV